MKFYLSSYQLGSKKQQLPQMAPKKKILYIPNALDFSTANPQRKKKHIQADMRSLQELGLACEELDLQKYFHRKQALRHKLDAYEAVFISGGNVFVLRQAMKLCGLDEILKELKKNNFLYAGYSAGVCVLSPRLDAYAIVDDATDMPYAEQKEVIWNGLSFLDYVFLPHWDSDHPESEAINKGIKYCQKKGLKYKALRDGEVLIIEDSNSL